jgi:hypothetical protein
MPELPYGAPPVPATPIGDLRQWRLDVRCSRCRQHTVLGFEYLAQRYGRRVSVSEIVRRLRCRGFRGEARCGAKPSRVVLIEVFVHGKSAEKVREIVVVGGRGSR